MRHYDAWGYAKELEIDLRCKRASLERAEVEIASLTAALEKAEADVTMLLQLLREERARNGA